MRNGNYMNTCRSTVALTIFLHHCHTHSRFLKREEGMVDNLLFEQFSPKTARKWRPFPARPLNIPLGPGLETPPPGPYLMLL